MNLDVATFHQDPALFLKSWIKDFVLRSAENRFSYIDDSPIFREPLVGFASGDDPLFKEYKRVIGEFHLSPEEALKQGTGSSPKEWKGLSLICWVLPLSSTTRQSNRKRKRSPSKRWAHTREYGEGFNNLLRKAVVGLLTELGYPAIAPAISPLFQRVELPQGLASNWSERHILYAAGLGTFSLSDGFITPQGMAHRCGSVVVALELPPSPKIYTTPFANCRFLIDGSCRACIVRCPCGAITERGHDKIMCYQYLLKLGQKYRKVYNIAGETGCGLCQTKVPCEAGIPV